MRLLTLRVLPMILLTSGALSAHAIKLGHSFSPERVVLGGKLSYSYELTNDGGDDESGTLFTNRLPVNTVFVSAVVTNGTYTVSNNVFSFRPERLRPGEGTLIQVVVTPVAGLLATNLACWVSSAGVPAYAFSVAPVSPALPGPKLVVGRKEHSSTLLRDGRVLLVGGLVVKEPYMSRSVSAEVYEPEEERFSLVGSMTAARASHTATMLPDGTVLVACGTAEGPEPESAEVFDPASDTFTSAGKLEVRRAMHTATLLANGDVILAGGNRTNTLLERLHLEDGNWVASRAGNLLLPRTGHTASLLGDGTIVFAGGTMLFAAGIDDTNGFAEVFNPATGLSRMLAEGAALPVVAASGGRLLLHAEQNAVVEGTAVYDIESHTFIKIAPRPARFPFSHYLTLKNGDVLETSGIWTFNVNIFGLRAATWRSAPPLNIARSSHSAVELSDGRILLTGGADLDGIRSGDMRSTELYALRLDLDRDGMDDQWELAHGLDPSRREDAIEDLDGEGHTNFQEYLAGTDPRDPENVLKIETPQIVDGRIRIRFPTVVGKYYRVEKSIPPDSTTWVAVVTSIAGNGQRMEVTDPLATETAPHLYRIVLLP